MSGIEVTTTTGTDFHPRADAARLDEDAGVLRVVEYSKNDNPFMAMLQSRTIRMYWLDKVVSWGPPDSEPAKLGDYDGE